MEQTEIKKKLTSTHGGGVDVVTPTSHPGWDRSDTELHDPTYRRAREWLSKFSLSSLDPGEIHKVRNLRLDKVSTRKGITEGK